GLRAVHDDGGVSRSPAVRMRGRHTRHFPRMNGTPMSLPAPSRVAESDRVHSVRAALRSPRILRTEALAGLVVALALIPEAISFSIIAGVDPQVGLFASFTMAV